MKIHKIKSDELRSSIDSNIELSAERKNDVHMRLGKKSKFDID